jgi:hypothetical protein
MTPEEVAHHLGDTVKTVLEVYGYQIAKRRVDRPHAAEFGTAFGSTRDTEPTLDATVCVRIRL